MSLPKSHGHSLGKERGQGTARRGRVVALSQWLDPAVTARNPPAALPGAFMHFPAVAEALGAAAHRGNRADAASGSWGREGRGKKTFPLPRQPDAVDPRVDNDREPAQPWLIPASLAVPQFPLPASRGARGPGGWRGPRAQLLSSILEFSKRAAGLSRDSDGEAGAGGT